MLWLGPHGLAASSIIITLGRKERSAEALPALDRSTHSGTLHLAITLEHQTSARRPFQDLRTAETTSINPATWKNLEQHARRTGNTPKEKYLGGRRSFFDVRSPLHGSGS